MIMRPPQSEPAEPIDQETTAALALRLEAAAQVRLGRSLGIRHVNTGSCNGCELELRALNNVLYDLERFGLRFVRQRPLHRVTPPFLDEVCPTKLARAFAYRLKTAWRNLQVIVRLPSDTGQPAVRPANL